ncbi:MAG: peptigoglycan-binding protein LysM [Treponema sp.]|nr:MAG: peptigoglycan-binding protein LysM [Treponema sp.]
MSKINWSMVMKKKYIILAVCVFALFVASIFNVLSLGNSRTNTSGMGGGDDFLPTAPPDDSIDPLAASELYYSVYIVKKGDIVGEIAERYGVSQDSIISLNKLKNTRTLQIGQILKIPSLDGIVYTVKKGDTPDSIADDYKISLEKITLVNNIENNNLTAGSVVFLPDAKLDWVTVQEINGDLFVTPLRASYRVTSGYGWRRDPFSRRRSFHNGVDLAAYWGAPVHSALAGTVIATGYSRVYGNYVIVRHHSGYQTMYGHLASILVRRGAYVTAATKIATVGSTGRSTGPHLHFTVYKNGATINPFVVWSP